MARISKITRRTKEVNADIEINLDGSGKYQISTGVEFLDHMLSLFAKHAVLDLKIKAKGDIGIDIHHTNEDIGIALGDAINQALGSREKITRFGFSYVAMDDALVRVVLDISGRAYCKINPIKLKITEDRNYTYSHFKQFFKGLIDHAGITLHLDILEGEDYHHILEAGFKAFALALKTAVAIDSRKKGLPTTKGKIDKKI